MPDLESIRKRAEAIIPGPWRWYGNTQTDQVYLGTNDRGHLILLSPEVHSTESVFNHDWCESYTLEQARANVRNFCGRHDEGEEETVKCRCAEIEEFLRGELDPKDPYNQAKDLDHRPEGWGWMSRGITHHGDMQLAHPEPPAPPPVDGGNQRDRKRLGGRRLSSYREFVRYEVLGFRTKKEFEKHAASAKGNRTVDEALYREDWCGIDVPEMDFIQHAAEDIPFLLAEIDALHDDKADLTQRVLNLSAQLARKAGL